MSIARLVKKLLIIVSVDYFEKAFLIYEAIIFPIVTLGNSKVAKYNGKAHSVAFLPAGPHNNLQQFVGNYSV